MAGILNSVSQLVTGSPVTNPGNSEAQNDLGTAEQARNDASSRYQQVGQQILQAFQQLVGSTPNPATSSKYVPLSQNPGASSVVTPPTVGSVYSGFNPGQVPTVSGGGYTQPNVSPTYKTALNTVATPTKPTYA